MSSPRIARIASYQARGLRHASSTGRPAQSSASHVLRHNRTLTPSELQRLRQKRLRISNHGSNSRSSSGQPPQPPSKTPSKRPRSKNELLAVALARANNSDLVADVQIADDPDAVLPLDHPAMSILGHSSLVIQRQLEMMNVILGFEQANRYIIMDGCGNTLGYMAEQDHGIGQSMARQLFRTHRSFTTHIFDKRQREVLRIHRPFSYINSRVRIYDAVPKGGFAESGTPTATTNPVVQDSATTSSSASMSTSIMNHSVDAALTAPQISPLKSEEMRIIGESQQQWAAFRRKYNLFSNRPIRSIPPSPSETKLLQSGQKPISETTALTEAKVPEVAIEAGMTQFAYIDEPLLSWDFTLRSAEVATIGSVNRNFSGFAREIFTDTGVYVLRMDSAVDQHQATNSGERVVPMSLDARAVMLATAISIDFDYFSKSSNGIMEAPIFFPWPMGGGGGSSSEPGVGAAGAAGAAGAMGSGAAQGMYGDDGSGRQSLDGDEGEWTWDDSREPSDPQSEGKGSDGSGGDSGDNGDGGEGSGAEESILDAIFGN